MLVTTEPFLVAIHKAKVNGNIVKSIVKKVNFTGLSIAYINYVYK